VLICGSSTEKVLRWMFTSSRDLRGRGMKLEVEGVTWRVLSAFSVRLLKMPKQARGLYKSQHGCHYLNTAAADPPAKQPSG
jgi:hypothetical protein